MATQQGGTNWSHEFNAKNMPKSGFKKCNQRSQRSCTDWRHLSNLLWARGHLSPRRCKLTVGFAQLLYTDGTCTNRRMSRTCLLLIRNNATQHESEEVSDMLDIDAIDEQPKHEHQNRANQREAGSRPKNGATDTPEVVIIERRVSLEDDIW